MRPGPEQQLFDEYAGRLPFALKVIQVEERRPLEGDERRAREAELITRALPSPAIIIALDERGETIGSVAFARKLEHWQDHGAKDVAFVIGGADGLTDDIRQQADFIMSLGAMTWPHMLVRGMLAEQLYRASSILAGHPYHRE